MNIDDVRSWNAAYRSGVALEDDDPQHDRAAEALYPMRSGGLFVVKVLTADNITETAILWLREDLVAEGASKEDIGATWVALHDLPTPVQGIHFARQRRVDLINARPAFLARITKPIDREAAAALLKRYLAVRARLLDHAIEAADDE
jgi:hypothetical protein